MVSRPVFVNRVLPLYLSIVIALKTNRDVLLRLILRATSVFSSNNATTQKHRNTATQQRNNATTQQRNNATTQQRNNATTQQRNMATVEMSQFQQQK
ncbi:hypothetical protein K501DRAFT_21700 [Backusella circina FSU 941]|nr:hypothetical protein K501DRAFT_21700 [Backusella circina FSU 941]